jgi:hypothetical protein
MKPVDYALVNELLGKEREISVRFLKDAIFKGN